MFYAKEESGERQLAPTQMTIKDTKMLTDLIREENDAESIIH